MPAGRPPLFESADSLQEKISEYFQVGLTVKKVLVGKPPKQYQVEIEVPTITGLSYYLGFESRQSFYAYEKKPQFSYTIKRARLFIEKHYEEMLQTGNTTGAIFALKNFDWSDKQEIDHKVDGGYKVTLNLNGGSTNRLHTALDSGLSGEDN
jgi:hypothetical protein